MPRLEYLSQAALVVLAVLAAFVALELAEDIFAPMTLAFVIGIVMSPMSDRVARLGMPPVVSAAASLLVICLLIFLLALFFEPLVRRAVEAMPRVMAELNAALLELRDNFRGIEQATRDVSRALGGDSGQGVGAGEGAALPSVEDALFMAPIIVGQIVIFAGTLFFFLLTRSDVYDYLASAFDRGEDRADLARRFVVAEQNVARYFLTITLINAAYAVVVSGVMALVGLPSPWLWGISAGLLNFVLYLGPVVFVVACLLGGLTAFDGLYSLMPAAAYLGLNLLESQFVTPTLVGQQLQTNPLAIFVALVIFLWLWGAVGGIVAIPLLLWFIALSSEVRGQRRHESGEPERLSTG